MHHVLLSRRIDPDRPLGLDGLGQIGGEADDRGQIQVVRHVHHRIHLDVQELRILLRLRGVASTDFLLAQDIVLLKEIDVLLLDDAGKCIWGGLQIRQASALCFLLPLLRIAVALKENPLVITEGVAHKAHRDIDEVLFFDSRHVVDEAIALLRHRSIQHYVGVREVLLAATHTELKLVASKGEGARTVAVSVVAQEVRERRDAQVHHLAGRGFRFFLLDQRFDDRVQRIAQIYRDDRRWRLVGTQTMVVPDRGNRGTQQIRMVVNRSNETR